MRICFYCHHKEYLIYYYQAKEYTIRVVKYLKSHAVEDDYIFGIDALYTVKYAFPFLGLLLSSIGFVFLLFSIPNNLGPGIASSAIFVIIGIFFILFSKRVSNLHATIYTLNEDTAANHGKTTVFASRQLSLYVCILPLLFNARGGGIVHLPVYLVSNSPITYISRYETNILLLAEKAMNMGIVVLPVNGRTTAWIQQATNITPPEYPKVAYIQKKAN